MRTQGACPGLVGGLEDVCERALLGAPDAVSEYRERLRAYSGVSGMKHEARVSTNRYAVSLHTTRDGTYAGTRSGDVIRYGKDLGFLSSCRPHAHIVAEIGTVSGAQVVLYADGTVSRFDPSSSICVFRGAAELGLESGLLLPHFPLCAYAGPGNTVSIYDYVAMKKVLQAEARGRPLAAHPLASLVALGGASSSILDIRTASVAALFPRVKQSRGHVFGGSGFELVVSAGNRRLHTIDLRRSELAKTLLLDENPQWIGSHNRATILGGQKEVQIVCHITGHTLSSLKIQAIASSADAGSLFLSTRECSIEKYGTDSLIQNQGC